MPALAACYFCGDAVDASLEEHAVPPDAPADDQVSVTLCADCHGKLAALLEELPLGASDADVPEAPDADPTDSSETSSTATAPTESAGTAVSDTETTGDGADRDDAAVASDAETPVSESDAGSTPEPEVDPDAATTADTEAAPGSRSAEDLDPLSGEQEPIFADEDGTLLGEDDPADEELDASPFSDDASPEDSSGPGDPEADGADTDSTAPGHDPADREASAVEVSTSSGSGSARRSASSGDATDRGTDEGPLADVSPRTYNRVVRLLQNREFPVDRADFEALATSAYELDHGECAAALDGAIEKGLLEERDGALHRPE